MVYQWKPGYHAKVDAQIAADVFTDLEKKGKLTAENVVKVSKDKESPLHECFEWSNPIAAQKWREQQARVMIGAIITTVSVQKGSREESFTVRAYHHTDNDGHYNNLVTILKSRSMQQTILAEANRDLKAFENKYGGISELFGLMTEIKRYLAEREGDDW